MKRIVLLAALVLVLASCGNKDDDDDKLYLTLRKNMHWKFEKSPLSGRCYEVMYSYVDNTHATLVMVANEVTCEEAKLR